MNAATPPPRRASRAARSFAALACLAASAGCDPGAVDPPRDGSHGDAALPDAVNPPPDALAADARPTPDAAPDAVAPVPCGPAEPGSTAQLELPSPVYAGSDAVVIARGPEPYTNVAVRAVGPGGTLAGRFLDVQSGSAPYRWRFALGPLMRGPYCVTFSADGHPALAFARLDVLDAPAGARTVYRVTANHQWTCDEQPDWGNFVDAYVTDEHGQPVVGAVVQVANTGNNDGGAGRFANPPPTQIVTDEHGYARFANYWPSGRFADGTNAMFVFSLRVAGGYSDTASEITSGFWESNTLGASPCTYCGGIGTARNVYGHWSYTVRFQRTLGPAETCVVTTDHAGMSRCPVPEHVGHDAPRTCTPLP